jgi:LCP family protein required for cell wall assembly
VAAVAIVVLVAAAVIGSYAYIDHRFHEATFVKVKHLVKVKSSGPHANAQTILLIGSTSRCVLNGKQAVAFGTCASTGPPGAATGITGVNSDVIMLLHTDPTTHRVSILSLPRDLVLYNVRQDNFHKVDAALASGPSQLVALVEQDLGIAVNHFVELNFDTFQSVVNTLGGVKVYFPDRVLDTLSGLNITTPGCHLLNGNEALALVRARHMHYWVHGVEEYDGSGDLGRIPRVHEFLRILASAVAARGLGNPIADNDLLGEIIPDLKLDSTFTLHNMVDLVLDFHSVNPNKAPETTLPIIEYFTDYMYEGYDYGSVVLPSYPRDQQTIDNWLGIKRPPSSSLRPSSITIRVLDGAGDAAAAAETTAKLRTIGYRIVGSGTWPAVGPLSETVVEYSPGHEADAERVMRSLSGIVSMTEAPVRPPAGSDVPSSTGSDVTVITGTNFSVVAPSAAGSSRSGTKTASGSKTHRKPRSTAISSGSSAVDSLLAPVSSAAAPLPPYDPRACPSS